MWCADLFRVRALAGALLLAGFVAGCSDIYYDRRQTVLFGAQDAVASNVAIHTIDPWPKAAADRNIPGQGTTVAIAAERYRTGKVTRPQGLGTTSSWKQSQGADGAPTVAGQTSGGSAVKD
ncbi:hypothetical protein [Rhodoplanes roseus]|uniref:Uncharacterized protein n=1 Tax=Rhodoplanes roseus TaxID=29409 RepID=A0A327L5Z0_9BRAD|nr:hypothetical protein [Rhodoplanes roseus]RAI45293.1 hypothetical protein CH341_04675 [Rhodoplanes roseus]